MKQFSKILPGLIAICGVLLWAGCGHEATSSNPLERTTVRATVITPMEKDGQSVQSLSLSGKIQAARQVDISPRMMGYLNSVNVKLGDRVRAGQVLATISSQEIKAKIAQAEAAILEAQSALQNIANDFERIQSLFAKESATQKELDDITAAKEMAAARVAQAQQMKQEAQAMNAYTTVTAPFGGVITQKYVQTGDMANIGKPLFALEGEGAFQAEVMVPESDITRIRPGQAVKVRVKSTNQEISGTISEISRSALHTGGQYLAKVDFAQKEAKNVDLYSGMYVNVMVPLKTLSSDPPKVLVEQQAIVREGQLTGIYTLTDSNLALLRWVRLGRSYGDQVEILSGLSNEEPYLLEPDSRLANGVKVETR